jgi:small subunit ribosomal protein S17
MADETENNAQEEKAAEAAAATGDPAAEAGAAAEAPSEPAEVLTPKQRRTRVRAAKTAAVPTRAQRSAEERQAERDVERKRKAEIRSKWRSAARTKARARRGDGAEPLPLLHPGQQKTRQGVVVSDRASKTIVVRIDVTRRHPFYQKVVRTSTTLHAHDEAEDAHIGDTVVVRESRPLSKTKRWRLVEVLERAR